MGKTTILNGMIEAVTSKGTSNAKFYDLEGGEKTRLIMITLVV